VIRVVLDTNIVVAALLTPHGIPARTLSVCLNDPEVELCISDEVYAEYEGVIRRPKFQRSADNVEDTLRGIRVASLWFKPTQRLGICSDPDDLFMECAEAATANYLVTGNTRHFPPIWKGTRVVTARQFLDIIAE